MMTTIFRRGGLHRCAGLHPDGDMAGAFAALRGGASCQSRTAGERARTMQSVMLRLYQLTVVPTFTIGGVVYRAEPVHVSVVDERAW